MPVTADLAQPLSEAIVAILHASAAAQTAIGRASDFVVPYEDTSESTVLPTYVYRYLRDREVGGIGDEREAVFELLAVAEGDDALAKANALVAIARTALTYNAFQARGLEAYVAAREVEGGEGTDEQTRGLALMRLLLTIRATAP